MSAARFTKVELRRALDVIESAGVSFAVRIEPDGAITLLPCSPVSVQGASDDPFDEWLRERNASAS